MKPNQPQSPGAAQSPGKPQGRPDAHNLLATTRKALKPLLSDININPSQRATLLMAVRALGICQQRAIRVPRLVLRQVAANGTEN